MGATSADLLRKINLVEVLREAAECEGLDVREPTDDQVAAWSEQQLRDYYSSAGKSIPGVQQQQGSTVHAQTPSGPATPTSSSAAAAAVSGGATTQALPTRSWNPVPQQVFDTWFPGLRLSGTQQQQPRATLLCFHSSGNAEDMFTSEGTGSRRAPSPLLEWCRQHGVQMLAPQLPGRGQRLRESPLTSCQAVAQQLLPVVAPQLQGGQPWAVVGHSMGCWAAYELLLAAHQHGLPAPTHAFFSAMPGPLTPQQQRPWRQQRHLDEEQFKEECRGWDINEVVFDPSGLWGMYQPMLRADFRLFDEYEADAALAQPAFRFPLTTFWGDRDRRVTEQLVQGWSTITSGPFKCHRISGNHLWPLDKAPKQQWLAKIVEELQDSLPL